MNKGFTILELVMVVGVLTMLSAILIVNIHIAEPQIILFREQAKIINAFSRAKSLSIATFGEAVCGYGVHFDQASDTFWIFKDLADECATSDHIYSGSSEMFESFQLDSAVQFSALGVSDVLFIPPDPSVKIFPDQEEATIEIETPDLESSVIIKINRAGQIST